MNRRAICTEHLFQFCAQITGFRSWKFKVKSASEKALAQAAMKIIGRDCLTGRMLSTAVAIGDWSRRDGILRGKPSGPVKKFKLALKKRAAFFVEVDEYRTSKTCSLCGCENDPVHLEVYPTKRQRKKQRKKDESTGILNLYPRDEPKKLSKIHRILRCSNNECSMLWNRDINSARNHVQLLDCILDSKPRPLHLTRGIDLRRGTGQETQNQEGSGCLPKFPIGEFVRSLIPLINSLTMMKNCQEVNPQLGN